MCVCDISSLRVIVQRSDVGNTRKLHLVHIRALTSLLKAIFYKQIHFMLFYLISVCINPYPANVEYRVSS